MVGEVDWVPILKASNTLADKVLADWPSIGTSTKVFLPSKILCYTINEALQLTTNTAILGFVVIEVFCSPTENCCSSPSILFFVLCVAVYKIIK